MFKQNYYHHHHNNICFLSKNKNHLHQHHRNYYYCNNNNNNIGSFKIIRVQLADATLRYSLVLFLSHFLLATLLLAGGFQLAPVGATETSTEAGYCRLAPTDPSLGLGLSCQLLFSDQTLKLDKCQQAKSDSLLKECHDTIDTTKSICYLEIELTQLIQIKILPLINSLKCQGQNEKEFTLILSSIKESGTNLTIFPSNSTVVKVDNLKMIEPNQKLLDGKFISDNFIHTKRIEISKFEFTNITQGSFSSQYLPKLEVIEIKDSSIHDVISQSFKLRKQFRTLKFVNVKMAGQFKTSSIGIKDTECEIAAGSIIEIQIESSSLTANNFEKDFISVEQLSSCNRSIKLKINLLHNSFVRTISQQIFGNLVETLRKRNGIDLEFSYDPIDCCLDTNRWFISSITKTIPPKPPMNSSATIRALRRQHYHNREASNQTASSIFNIQCIDLGMRVENLSKFNASTFEEICTVRNDYPILMIGIVSILLLAALLAVFSFICFFYVLPMRGNVIMYDNHTRPSAFEASKDRPRSSGMVAKPSSSVAEIRSSRTALTATATGPLMESYVSGEPSKSRRSAMVRSPGEHPKSVRSPIADLSPPPSFGPKFKLPQKQAEKQPQKHAEKQTQKHAEKQPQKQAEKQPQKQTQKEPQKHVEKQPQKQAEKQPQKHIQSQKQTQKPRSKMSATKNEVAMKKKVSKLGNSSSLKKLNRSRDL